MTTGSFAQKRIYQWLQQKPFCYENSTKERIRAPVITTNSQCWLVPHPFSSVIRLNSELSHICNIYMTASHRGQWTLRDKHLHQATRKCHLCAKTRTRPDIFRIYQNDPPTNPKSASYGSSPLGRSPFPIVPCSKTDRTNSMLYSTDAIRSDWNSWTCAEDLRNFPAF